MHITSFGLYVVIVCEWPASGCGDVPLLESQPSTTLLTPFCQVIPLASLPSAHLWCSLLSQRSWFSSCLQRGSLRLLSLSLPWQDRQVHYLRPHLGRGRKLASSRCLKFPPNSLIFSFNWSCVPLELMYYSFVIWCVYSLKKPCTSLAKTDTRLLLKYVLCLTWKDVQHYSLSEKCKSKPQWGTITRQSEWLLSKSLQAINVVEGVEKREPSYTVGGNAN